MTDRPFRTAADRRAERRAAADKAVERLKRKVEAALGDYPPGARERGEVMRYCNRIGLRIVESAGAGLEFQHGDLEELAERLATAPMPASLQRYGA